VVVCRRSLWSFPSSADPREQGGLRPTAWSVRLLRCSSRSSSHPTSRRKTAPPLGVGHECRRCAGGKLGFTASAEQTFAGKQVMLGAVVLMTAAGPSAPTRGLFALLDKETYSRWPVRRARPAHRSELGKVRHNASGSAEEIPPHEGLQRQSRSASAALGARSRPGTGGPVPVESTCEWSSEVSPADGWTCGGSPSAGSWQTAATAQGARSFGYEHWASRSRPRASMPAGKPPRRAARSWTLTLRAERELVVLGADRSWDRHDRWEFNVVARVAGTPLRLDPWVGGRRAARRSCGPRRARKRDRYRLKRSAGREPAASRCGAVVQLIVNGIRSVGDRLHVRMSTVRNGDPVVH